MLLLYTIQCYFLMLTNINTHTQQTGLYYWAGPNRIHKINKWQSQDFFYESIHRVIDILNSTYTRVNRL
jgi:hypothetical protein